MKKTAIHCNETKSLTRVHDNCKINHILCFIASPAVNTSLSISADILAAMGVVAPMEMTSMCAAHPHWPNSVTKTL